MSKQIETFIIGSTQRTPAGGFKVFVNDKLLDPVPSQRLWNFSPDGFAWGYSGSGPAQFALALLLRFSNASYAMMWYQQFKEDVIAQLPKGKFKISADVVVDWIGKHRVK